MLVDMKALIIANPESSTQNERLFRRVIPQLQEIPSMTLRAQFTHHPGHATQIAQEAIEGEDAPDAIIMLGGDGTVNEVINGLKAAQADRPMPVLGVIPTGSANVFARALGFPAEPVHATEVLARAIAENDTRSIDLGLWNGQWFAVNAGFGLDASVIATMERARRRGFAATPLRYLRVALSTWNKARRNTATISVTATTFSGTTASKSGLPLCLVSNTDPWTFLGPLPVLANPRNSFDVGLSVFGLTSITGLAGVLAVARMLGVPLSRRGTKELRPHTFVLNDASTVQLHCPQPQAFQVDGEYAGEVTDATLESIPDALVVYAPSEEVKAEPLSVLKTALGFFDLRL